MRGQSGSERALSILDHIAQVCSYVSCLGPCPHLTDGKTETLSHSRSGTSMQVPHLQLRAPSSGSPEPTVPPPLRTAPLEVVEVPRLGFGSEGDLSHCTGKVWGPQNLLGHGMHHSAVALRLLKGEASGSQVTWE